MADRVEKGWDLLDRGDSRAAHDAAREVLAKDPDNLEALLLAGAALMDGGELDEAESPLRRASRLAPSCPRVLLSLAQLFYETCRFEEALETTGTVLSKEEIADARWLEGLALDLLGRRERADVSFARAAVLDPERFGGVPSLGEARLRKAVDDALADLPDAFRERLREVPIVLRDVPTQEMLGSMEYPSPDLLGLFVGIPLTERSHSDPTDVSSITLFTRNLERACFGGAELVEEIRVTLLHEIGHYLGMTEEDLEEAGYS